MGFFNKKTDPLSERSRRLTARIAELESKIKQLNHEVEPEDPRRLRSTAYPGGAAAVRAPRVARNGEPVFESVDHKQIKETPEPLPIASRKNFDLIAWFERIKLQFRGPPAANPKLVNYLAAGNIQGLRPLRYEKRIARNRFVALTLVLILVLFGLFCFLARRH